MKHTIEVGQIYRCTSDNYVYTDSLFRILEATEAEITMELIEASEKALRNSRSVGYVSQLAAFRFQNIMTIEHVESPEHYETEVTPASFNDLFGG